MIRHPDCPVCKTVAPLLPGRRRDQCNTCVEMMIAELASIVVKLTERVKALEERA